jgi:hypothetical protein
MSRTIGYGPAMSPRYCVDLGHAGPLSGDIHSRIEAKVGETVAGTASVSVN